MFNVGGGEIIAILVIALIVLGPDKLPNAARQAGKYLNEFRRISSGFQDEIRGAMDLATTTDSEPVVMEPAEPSTDPADAADADPDTADADRAEADRESSMGEGVATETVAFGDDLEPAPASSNGSNGSTADLNGSAASDHTPMTSDPSPDAAAATSQAAANVAEAQLAVSRAKLAAAQADLAAAEARLAAAHAPSEPTEAAADAGSVPPGTTGA